MLRGALYTGSTGLAMEAGHVSVDPNGRPCPCGNRGCLNVETDAERFMAAAGRVARRDTAVLDQAIAVLQRRVRDRLAGAGRRQHPRRSPSASAWPA